MSSTEALAQKIAELIKAEDPAAGLSSIKASPDAMNARLDILEAARESQAAVPVRSFSHPSLDKFAIAEAIADAMIGGKDVEKACTFEPNNRPCDHCSMCSSRGF